MALTELEDRLVMSALGGPAGDNDIRRALRKWFNEAPPDTVGSVAAATVAVEEFYGNGYDHITRFTLTDFVVGAIGDNADKAIGAEVYAFPGGDLIIFDSTIRAAFTSEGSVTTIADGEYGMGTAVGTGAVDTLGEVGATAEDIMTGQAISTYNANGGTVVCHSTVTGQTPSANGLIMRASGGLAHKLFLNVAATWPDIDPAEGNLLCSGIITCRWRKVS
jgi:hypothetical protein